MREVGVRPPAAKDLCRKTGSDSSTTEGSAKDDMTIMCRTSFCLIWLCLVYSLGLFALFTCIIIKLSE